MKLLTSSISEITFDLLSRFLGFEKVLCLFKLEHTFVKA